MNKKIEAVFESDLSQVLEDLELIEKFNASALKCTFCGDIISRDNLQYIFTRSNRIVVSCNGSQCITRSSEFIK